MVIVWAVVGAQLIWFGADTASIGVGERMTTFTINYTTFSALLVAAWALVLTVGATREHRIVGVGPEEYKRVANSSLQLFGIVAILGFAFQIQFSRGYLLVALPFGLAGLLLERWLWRQWLHSVRRLGRYSANCIVVGGSRDVRGIVSTLLRQSWAGYHPVAVCTSRPGAQLDLPPGIPVRPVSDLQKLMTELDADTVIMAAGHGMSAREVRELSWTLVPGEQHLVMVPNLVDVAGPRIRTRPVAGLPLVHVETPRYIGAGRFAKRAFDLVGALFLVVALSPVLLATAVAVKLTSPGPVFFIQTRIGKDGQPFRMIKFRSMRQGADAELRELLEAQGTSDKPLFKVQNDPRLTPIGKFIRATSIDELPQLFNVIGGSMSLVGPRPQVEAETALYDDMAARRLTVKPGVTGLWQVSGRSSLTWEEAIRLDLYYVENWSLVGDIVLLWRTVKAVLARDGAY